MTCIASAVHGAIHTQWVVEIGELPEEAFATHIESNVEIRPFATNFNKTI